MALALGRIGARRGPFIYGGRAIASGRAKAKGIRRALPALAAPIWLAEWLMLISPDHIAIAP